MTIEATTRFEILGPVRALRASVALSVGGPKQRSLLAILLLSRNRLVLVDRIIDLLWADRPPPARARNLVQGYVSDLRRALSHGGHGRALRTAPSGYQLDVDPGQLDLEQFERLVEGSGAARDAGETRLASDRLREALALWKGRALSDVSRGTLHADTVRLEEARLAALEDRIDLDLQLGRHADLVGELTALRAEHPLRERMIGQLVLALYRAGRKGEALGVYREARHEMVEALGLEPGRDLQLLERAVLKADPMLDLAPGPAPATIDLPIPRELPIPPADFVGRTDEVAALRDLLGPAAGERARPVVTAIDGPGGIGKSALAIHVAHVLAGGFPDGQLYVNLLGSTPGLEPLRPLDALGRMLRSLGLSPGAVPEEADEAAARFRSLAASRRLLVVLDNAHSVDQVRPLLPGSPTCGVLVTSRRVLATLEGAETLHLDVLPEAQAVELLGRVAGRERVAAESGSAAEVVSQCGFLPLAIRIAAARLAARPTRTVQGLATELADSTHRLEALHVDDLAVRASFDVSLHALERSPRALDSAAAAAFGVLGLPDGPDIGVAAAARLLSEPEPAAAALMERLVDEQLLEMPRPGRYQFHDLVRLYARAYATSRCSEAGRAAALDRVLAFYTATAWGALAKLDPRNQRLELAEPRWSQDGLDFEHAPAALRWLEAERPNLMAAITQALEGEASTALPELVGQLAAALGGFFNLRGYARDWVRSNEVALEIARRYSDETGQVLALRDLGVALGRLGRYEEQLIRLLESLPMSRRLGIRHQAAVVNALGAAYLWLGRYADAVSCHLECLELYRRLPSRHGQALSLNNLGMAYERLERYAEALDCYEQALRIDREHGVTPLQGAVLNSLGSLYRHLGRYEDAIACQNASLAVSREFRDRLTPAHGLHELGLVHLRLARRDDAVSYLEESLAIFRELGDRRGVAAVLGDLGEALQAVDDERARAAWEEAFAISGSLPTPEAAEIRARMAARRTTVANVDLREARSTP